MMVTHSEIFPGMYASTTETADYLLSQLGIPRRAVLKWGPRGLQQLGEAVAGGRAPHGLRRQLPAGPRGPIAGAAGMVEAVEIRR
jgi:hypothetical protein